MFLNALIVIESLLHLSETSRAAKGPSTSTGTRDPDAGPAGSCRPAGGHWQTELGLLTKSVV